MLLLEHLEDVQPLECYNYLSVLCAVVASLVEDQKQTYIVLSLGLLIYYYVRSTTFYIVAHWRVWILVTSLSFSLILRHSTILDIIVLISAILTLILLVLFPIVDKKKLTGKNLVIIHLIAYLLI